MIYFALSSKQYVMSAKKAYFTHKMVAPSRLFAFPKEILMFLYIFLN